MANPFTAKTAGAMGGYMPGEWDIQAGDIERQRKMAEMLQQESMNDDLRGSMVGGIYVAPSWTQGIAKVLKSYQAGKMLESADQRQRDLAQNQNIERQTTLQKYADMLRGTPESMNGQMYQGGNNPDEDTGMGYRAAAAPDPKGANSVLLNSRDPALQQFGLQQILKETQGNADKFGKINPHDYTPESIQKFAATGDFAALVPVRKMELAPSGVAYNPYQVQPGQVFNDPNKLIAIGNNGAPVVNQPLVNAKKEIARSGAANVNVNTAQKPFLTEIGKGVGEAVNAAFGQAQQAQQTLANVDQIRSGLGSVFTGPGANARVTLAQIGETLGVNGRDTTEKLVNTRNVLQGLARQELAAAGQMKGQGQITESERAILRKAESGEINNLTVPEINTLLGAMEKTANYRISTHNANLERLRKNPNTAPMVEYLTLPSRNGGNQSGDVRAEADKILGGK